MSYRDRRSPDRGRERYPPATPIDSYIPPSSSRAVRPRSRSPTGHWGRSRTPPRPATDTWRGRPSSPTRRFDSRADSYASRDTRPRSPRRDYDSMESRRGDSSRLSRDRSAGPGKRERDPSPYERGVRSPPPAKRERIASPGRDYGRPRSPPRRAYSPPREGRGTYRPRSRSPHREERVDPYAAKSRPRTSPTPRVDSGRNSGTTSRRSSPRPYGRRPVESSAANETRNFPSASYRSPSQRDTPVVPPRSPRREEAEHPDSRSRRPADRDHVSNDHGYPPRESQPPGATPDYRERPPPSGPASSYRDGPPLATPPSGPTPTGPSMSAHNRNIPPSGPAYPRGGGYGSFRGRGGPPARDFSSPRRGSTSWAGASYGRGGGGSREPYTPRDPASPIDGRSPIARRDSSYGGGPSGGAAFRGSSNSTSTTYPRTQRFNQALSGIPEIKAGGEKLPPLHDTTKADKLEEEAARLRKLIDDKEMKKRQGLREWEKLEKESANASLRSELAEEHLRSLNGEGEGMAAAF